MQQIRFPQLKGGAYRVSSAARRDPQLYIERQVDESILAVQNNPPFNAQLWWITPVEGGMYRIACVRDDSAITANITLESVNAEREISSIWSIEPRGDAFVIGSSYGNLVLGIDTDDFVRTCERSNVLEQRWHLHLVDYSAGSIRPAGVEKHALLDSRTRKTDSIDYEDMICVDHSILLISTIHEITETFIKAGSYQHSLLGHTPPPEYQEGHGMSIPNRIQTVTKMENPAGRLREKDIEIKKLQDSIGHLTSDVETLTRRLNEKDEEIQGLRDSNKKSTSMIETLSQRLKAKDEEIILLRGNSKQIVLKMDNPIQRLRDNVEELKSPRNVCKPVGSRPRPIMEHPKEKYEETKRLQTIVTGIASQMETPIQPLKKMSQNMLDTEPKSMTKQREPLLGGHKGVVYSVTFSPDGELIASGGKDGTVRVWDSYLGKELKVLRGHSKDVNSVAFSPDSTRIASGSDDKVVIIWDARSGNKVLGPLTDHGDWVKSVQFSPDGTMLVSGSDNGAINVWNATSGARILGPLIHSQRVYSVAFSPDSTRIISGSRDNTVRVWDAKSGNRVLLPLQHPGWASAVAYTPDGLQIISGCEDGKVRMWDANSGALVLKLVKGEQGGSIWSVAVSPDGRRIASSSGHADVIHVWDARTGAIKKSWNHGSLVNSIAFSPDGEWIVSGANDGKIRLWPGK